MIKHAVRTVRSTGSTPGPAHRRASARWMRSAASANLLAALDFLKTLALCCSREASHVCVCAGPWVWRSGTQAQGATRVRRRALPDPHVQLRQHVRVQVPSCLTKQQRHASAARQERAGAHRPASMYSSASMLMWVRSAPSGNWHRKASSSATARSAWPSLWCRRARYFTTCAPAASLRATHAACPRQQSPRHLQPVRDIAPPARSKAQP